MFSNLFDLGVNCRLSDFAFFEVDHQPIIRADEANVEALLEFVPLAADHNPVTIAIGLRTGNDLTDDIGLQTAESLKNIRDLLMLEPQLRRVVQVLILTPAAIAEVRAGSWNPVG